MITEISLNNIEQVTDNDLITKKTILEDLSNNPFGKYLILTTDNDIIGYLYYSDIYDRAEINQFEVEISHRNCGKGKKLLNKMLEVVSLMQTFAKPFCIILFILCALGILMSIVFDTKKQKAFILGLILSVITYVGVIFAPDIVLFFAGWLSF